MVSKEMEVLLWNASYNMEVIAVLLRVKYILGVIGAKKQIAFEGCSKQFRPVAANSFRRVIGNSL
jgi:hypothetical protein